MLPPDTTTQGANLSTYPLDATAVSATALAPDASYQELMSSGAPGSLQAGLSKFHDIVCTLVRNYTTTTAQVRYMWGRMLCIHRCEKHFVRLFTKQYHHW